MKCPQLSFGDILPFLIIATVLVLAFFQPHVGIGVLIAWLVFVTVGLVRSSILAKSKAGKPVFFWIVFNIPTLIGGLIVWWRW